MVSLTAPADNPLGLAGPAQNVPTIDLTAFAAARGTILPSILAWTNDGDLNSIENFPGLGWEHDAFTPTAGDLAECLGFDLEFHEWPDFVAPTFATAAEQARFDAGRLAGQRALYARWDAELELERVAEAERLEWAFCEPEYRLHDNERTGTC